MARQDITEALGRLDDLTRRLRTECPWDREQDERSIVPHTVEEAYELADAAQRYDDAKLLDELGDVLFQVHFLSLLLEERGAGDLAAGGRAPERRKLIRRHPHVFPAAVCGGPGTGGTAGSGGSGTDADVQPSSAGEVLAQLGSPSSARRARAARPACSARSPRTCPALLYARKIQRRAASAGLDQGDAVPYESEATELVQLRAADNGEAAFEQIGELLCSRSSTRRASGASIPS